MKCPMCGEVNKLDVRFCEHCGARLDAPTTDATPVAPVIVPALTCTQCGAIVLPGELNCDNCGQAIAPAFVNNNQTSAELHVVDLPSEGFADTAVDMNSIHKNTQPSGTSGAIEYRIENTPTESQSHDESGYATQAGVVRVSSTPLSAPISQNDEPITQANQSLAFDDVSDSASAPVATEAEYVMSDEVDSAPPALPFDGDVQALKKRRQELEEEITRQREIMKQLDHMRRAFREVTPQAVLMGLSEAEEKLKAAEQEMESLPIPPEIDPAVIERLQKDLARQIEIIDQFEQLQRTFGSATPRAVLQGIIDARQTEERMRAELIEFGVEVMVPRAGSAAVAAVPPVVAPPAPVISPVVPNQPVATPPLTVAPVAPVVPADMLQPRVNTLMPVPANPLEPVVNPVINPVAPAARLQLESGTIVPLPTGRREIIIGRDDPISGVHPEIDMTPYGAESGGISRRHVRLTIIDGQWMITDLQSTNHTRVNGVRIDPGVPTPLPDSAQVVLGRIGFIFRSS
ncbi:MAG: FHA domain-containing protein [Chloroflexia bacterium]|nr:FHA domain-containing protein [Chloroflexia bacterium]